MRPYPVDLVSNPMEYFENIHAGRRTIHVDSRHVFPGMILWVLSKLTRVRMMPSLSSRNRIALPLFHGTLGRTSNTFFPRVMRSPGSCVVQVDVSVIIFKILQRIGNEIHWINPAKTAKIQPIQPKFEEKKTSGLTRYGGGPQPL